MLIYSMLRMISTLNPAERLMTKPEVSCEMLMGFSSFILSSEDGGKKNLKGDGYKFQVLRFLNLL